MIYGVVFGEVFGIGNVSDVGNNGRNFFLDGTVVGSYSLLVVLEGNP